MQKKRTTIRDVAKEAGVSIATVSQVLNGVDEFSEETVRKVWDTVNAMHYTPNLLAKQLLYSGREEENVEKTGLVLRAVYSPYTHQRSYFDRLEEKRVYLFDRLAAKTGAYAVNYIYQHKLGFRCPLIQRNLIDGIVLCIPHRKIVEQLSGRLPVVLTDLPADPEEFGVPIVNMDFASGFRNVFRKLTEAGCPGKLAVVREDYSGMEEFSGYHYAGDVLTAAAEAEMELEKDWVISMRITPETHAEVMRRTAEKILRMIRKDGVRIVAMQNETYADTLANLLAEDGIALNRDVFLVTNGNETDDRLVTVPYDWNGLYGTALDVLSRKIRGEDIPVRKYLVPCGRILPFKKT